MSTPQNIIVPNGAERFIGLQRLETQALGASIHYSKLGNVLYNIYEKTPFSKSLYAFYSANVEPRFRRKKIHAEYSLVMQREFASIEPHLPKVMEKIIGIGPGVAGLEAFISKSCSERKMDEPLIMLIDKTGLDPIHFGFQEKAAVYNSLDISKQTLISNGHTSENIQLVDAEDAQELTEHYSNKVDLVTSLIAWGFHFPVDVYLDLVVTLLRPGGRLIIDVRKDTDGYDRLRSAFSKTETILDDEKFHRVLAIK